MIAIIRCAVALIYFLLATLILIVAKKQKEERMEISMFSLVMFYFLTSVLLLR